MTNIQALGLIIARWSDTQGYARADELMERHRNLLPRRLSRAQLSGLGAIAQVVSTIGQLSDFARRQGDRASRTGRPEVKPFWDDLATVLAAIAKEVESLQQATGIGRGDVEGLRLRMAREFIQHLVAQGLYLAQFHQQH